MRPLPLLLVFVHFWISVFAGAADIPFVDREQWTSEQAAMDDSFRQPATIRLITIHQTETRNTDNMSREDEKALLRSILKHHRNTERSNNEIKKWGDIAYHYIIGPSGDVYRCRDLAFQSDSATILRSELEGNIAVCLMGDFRSAEEKQHHKPPTLTPNQLPTPAALKSLVAVAAMELHRHGLDIDSVKAHRDLQMIRGGSDCPGGLFYPMIKDELLPQIREQLKELNGQ